VSSTQTAAPAPSEGAQKFSPGSSYLMYGADPDKYYFLFMKHLKETNAKGLCVSRQHPDKLKGRYPELNVESYWLCKSTGDICITPTNLQKILSNINQFIKSNPGSAVMLEGLEYLISNNDFSKILAMIQGINEKVVMNKAVLLIPVDPATFDEKQKGLIEKDVDKVLDFRPKGEDPAEKMRRELSASTKQRLQGLCKQYGLTARGSREEIIQRLMDAASQQRSQPAAKEPPRPEEGEEDFELKLKQALESKLKEAEAERERSQKKQLEDMEKEKRAKEAEEEKRLKESQKRLEEEAKKLEKMRLDLERQKAKEEEEKKKRQLEAEKETARLEKERQKALIEQQRNAQKEAEIRQKEEARLAAVRLKAEREQAKQDAVLQKEALKMQERIQKDAEKGLLQPLTVQEQLNDFEASKRAENEIKTTFFGKHTEVLGDVSLHYLELLWYKVRALKGFAMFSKETTMFVLWDNYLREVVTDRKKGLIRTRGAGQLMDLTQNQIRAIRALSASGTSAEKVASKSDLAVGDAKKALGQLMKNNLVKLKYDKADATDYYYPTFILEISEDPLHKDEILPHSVLGEPSREVLSKGLKSKDVAKFLEAYLPTMTILETRQVFYPYYVAQLKSEKGTRRVYVDGVSGSVDEMLSSI
jgi:hypothetical protein